MPIRVVRVPVDDRVVPVPMGMRLVDRIKRRVPMAVMLIVHVPVLMLDFFV